MEMFKTSSSSYFNHPAAKYIFESRPYLNETFVTAKEIDDSNLMQISYI